MGGRKGKRKKAEPINNPVWFIDMGLCPDWNKVQRDLAETSRLIRMEQEALAVQPLPVVNKAKWGELPEHPSDDQNPWWD